MRTSMMAIIMCGTFAAAAPAQAGIGTLFRGKAGKAAQKDFDTTMGFLKKQVAGVHPRGGFLPWISRVSASAGSDWGLEGVGSAFSEKRRALEWAKGAEHNIRYLRLRLANYAKKTSVPGFTKARLRTLDRKITQQELKLRDATEALRSATGAIWRENSYVFMGATDDQFKQFQETMLK